MAETRSRRGAHRPDPRRAFVAEGDMGGSQVLPAPGDLFAERTVDGRTTAATTTVASAVEAGGADTVRESRDAPQAEVAQLPFEFAERRAARFPSTHPEVIFRWLEDLGKLEAYWPEYDMTTWFRNWREALPVVLCEQNAHVRPKVRA